MEEVVRVWTVGWCTPKPVVYLLQELTNPGTGSPDRVSKAPGVKSSEYKTWWDFPGGPVVKALPSNAGGVGSIPGRGSKIPHASWPKKPKHIREAIL